MKPTKGTVRMLAGATALLAGVLGVTDRANASSGIRKLSLNEMRAARGGASCFFDKNCVKACYTVEGIASSIITGTYGECTGFFLPLCSLSRTFTCTIRVYEDHFCSGPFTTQTTTAMTCS